MTYVVILLISLLSSPAKAGLFASETVQTYPADWPMLAGMSRECSEIQGTYVDPNRMYWKYEQYPGSPLGTKQEGTREAAWVVLGLAGYDIREAEHKVARTFVITFEPDHSLSIKYLIDEVVVAMRTFSKDAWSCTNEGLTISTLERTGVLDTKSPLKGRATHRSTLYKTQGQLYVKTNYETKARLFQIIPQSFLNIAWFRFPERASR